MSEQIKDAAEATATAAKLSVVDKLRMLLDITKKISRSLDVDEVLELVMDTLGSLVPYDAAGRRAAERYEELFASRSLAFARITLPADVNDFFRHHPAAALEFALLTESALEDQV